MRSLYLALALAIVGCGSEGQGGEASAGSSGTPDAGTCAPWEVTLPDMSCRPPGVPPEACAAGFEPDGLGGCNPVLPAEACGPGTMAIPGDTTCREVAPCEGGPWGAAPIDASTQFVDGSYSGQDSDGSEARPWTTIQDAVDAADEGAVVAIAAGTYAADVLVHLKPVRLWGRCPREVEIAGAGSVTFALAVARADGSEVHDLSVTGAELGVGVTSAENVVLDRLWVHDTDGSGVYVDDTLGAAQVVLSRSLVEKALGYGIYLAGAQLDLDSVVVRDTVEQAGPLFGAGVQIQLDLDTGVRGTATIRSSVIERSPWIGVFVGGADATIEGSVVRDTFAAGPEASGGRGIDVERDPVTGERGVLVLSGSVVERNRHNGVFIGGADGTIDATVVRDTQPEMAIGKSGRGVSAEDDPEGQRSTLTVRDSVIERNHDMGAWVSGSDGTFERTAIRDTAPRESDLLFGRGIGAGFSQSRAKLTMVACAVERNHETGIFVWDSDAFLDSVLVRGTKPLAASGLFGDGLLIAVMDAPPYARVERSRIEASARAGVSVFGGQLEMGTTVLECNPIPLAGENYLGKPYALQDMGGSRCGCGGEEEACAAVSAGLQPPVFED